MTQHPGSRVGQLILGSARIRAEAEFSNGRRPVAWELKKATELEERVRDHLPDRYDDKGPEVN